MDYREFPEHQFTLEEVEIMIQYHQGLATKDFEPELERLGESMKEHPGMVVVVMSEVFGSDLADLFKPTALRDDVIKAHIQMHREEVEAAQRVHRDIATKLHFLKNLILNESRQ